MSWADKTHQYKKIMVINMLIGLMFILSISLVPSITSSEWMTTILVSISYFGYAFFAYPIIGTMIDCATLRVLGDRKQQLYGRQKAFTPVGFGVSIFLTGLCIELWGPYAVFGTFATCVLAFVCICLVTDLSPYPWDVMTRSHNQTFNAEEVIIDNADNEDNKTGPVPSMWDLIERPEAVRFFVVMTFLGIIMGIVTAFLFLFIEKDLHGSPALVGLLGPLTSCTEIVCFYFAKNIFKWLGPKKMIIIAHIVLAVRCVIYMLATTISNGAYLAAASQPLHGIAYSFLWSAAVVEADNIAPPSLKARSQGLLGTMYLGLGAGIGALCGFAYEYWGGVGLWFLSMIVSFTSLFIYTSPIVDRGFQSLCGFIKHKRRSDGYTVISSAHDEDDIKDDNE
ncbi:major facilitator superfamily domain-containing protein [Circinella umbellata]|nr:major facilitator superfamily domain-containing protein [Circinella umbellata]